MPTPSRVMTLMGQTVTVDDSSSSVYYNRRTKRTSAAVTPEARVVVEGSRSTSAVKARRVMVLGTGLGARFPKAYELGRSRALVPKCYGTTANQLRHVEEARDGIAGPGPPWSLGGRRRQLLLTPRGGSALGRRVDSAHRAGRPRWTKPMKSDVELASCSEGAASASDLDLAA